MSDQPRILLLITMVVIYKLVKWQAEVTHQSPFTPPPPAPPPWNQLHFDFNHSHYVKPWKPAGDDYHSAQRWIEGGIKPSELDFAQWIKEVKGLSPKHLGEGGQLASLRSEWRSKNLPPGSDILFFD